jgi:hypothetical protein
MLAVILMDFKYLTSIIIVITCFACSRSKERNCRVGVEEVLKDNVAKVLVTKSSTGTVQRLADVGIDSTIGGKYDFYDNGQLKYYFFFRTRDGLGYGYKEKYDSIGGLIETEGSPKVLTNIKAGGDSFNIKWHVFTLNKIFQDINVRDSARQVLTSKVYNDPLFTNMNCIEFSYHGTLKKNEHFKVLLDVQYRNRCPLSPLLPLTDTVDLVWNQHN